MLPNDPDIPHQNPLPLRPRGGLFQNKWVLLLILIMLLAVGYVLTKSSNKSPESPTVTNSVSSQNATINVTKDGFLPSTLQVMPGTTINWINSDDKPHQVAADPYPKNDSIPDFDSTILLQPDESYSFTFENAGTYHYHDELNPLKFTGTIEVQ